MDASISLPQSLESTYFCPQSSALNSNPPTRFKGNRVRNKGKWVKFEKGRLAFHPTKDELGGRNIIGDKNGGVVGKSRKSNFHWRIIIRSASNSIVTYSVYDFYFVYEWVATELIWHFYIIYIYNYFNNVLRTNVALCENIEKATISSKDFYRYNLTMWIQFETLLWMNEQFVPFISVRKKMSTCWNKKKLIIAKVIFSMIIFWKSKKILQ